MKYAVIAMSVAPATGEVTGSPRTEVIDTEDNVLFAGATSEWDVEDAYHAFWNRLTPQWERVFPYGKDKVVVLSVQRL